MYNFITMNVENVRDQIARKKGNTPYFSNDNIVLGILTDYDNFPYNRFFRGIPSYSEPIVAEREAGWRIRNDDYYNRSVSYPEVSEPYPNHCFQTACSTVRPCHPKPDREELNNVFNSACNVSFR